MTGGQNVTQQLRVVAHGGGVQTTAILALAAQGQLDYKTFLFVNVGDDSEHPGSLRYLRDIAMPYAQAHSIDLIELTPRDAAGQPKTIRSWITRPGKKSDLIPVHLETGLAKRGCTRDFKIRTIARWLKQRGASPANPATVAMGISSDELQRANSMRRQPYERLVFPLLMKDDPGIGRYVSREDCKQIIHDAGLPLPGKSACYFCPFHTRAEWQDLASHQPEAFEQAAELEDFLLARKRELGHKPVYLSGALIPLREAFGASVNQETLPGLDYDQHCDNGWCMT